MKIVLYTISEELKMSHRDLVRMCQEAGIRVKSALTRVDEQEYKRIKELVAARILLAEQLSTPKRPVP